jgi:hypothetical protein
LETERPCNFSNISFFTFQYDLEKLKNICESSLIENLGVETVIPTLIVAEQNSVSLLKKIAMDFMKG